MNNLPKLALLNDWYAPEIVGGAENSISELAHKLKADNIEVKVFTLHQGAIHGEQKVDDVEVSYLFGLNIRQSYSTTSFVQAFEKLRVWLDLVTPLYALLQIRRYKPDFLVIHEADRFGIWLLFFSRLFFRKSQLIRVFHDLSETCLLRSRNKFGSNCNEICGICVPKTKLHAIASRFGKNNICNSHFVATELSRRKFNIDMKLIGHPILTYEKEEMELIFPKKKMAYSLGYVGRITKLKGVETLIRAANLSTPKWKVNLIGPIKLMYRHKLESLASDLDVEMTIHQPSRNPYDFMRPRVDCIVVSSESFEAFGKVPLEAVKAGIPVISCEIGGISEALDYLSPRPQVFTSGDAYSLASELDKFHRPDRCLILESKYGSLHSILTNIIGDQYDAK